MVGVESGNIVDSGPSADIDIYLPWLPIDLQVKNPDPDRIREYADDIVCGTVILDGDQHVVTVKWWNKIMGTE